MHPNITKVLIVLVIILFVYLIYVNFFGKTESKDSFVNIKKYIAQRGGAGSDTNSDNVSDENASGDTNSLDITNNYDNFDSNDEDQFNKKMTTKNSKNDKVNYAEGKRGNFGNSEWADDNLLSFSDVNNDKFVPNEADTHAQPTGGVYAKEKQNDPKDLFDVNKFLPQETRDDWFDVVPEPISVKNRHLINMSRCIGVNTMGTSKKNASYDFRGSPACPRFVVGPWNLSSIEPDTNIKSC